ncbi:unnamed protein product [Linum tenue]|uniref:Polygalacturonase n=1 Tax=Linum tenue TaxID=586396 RepID=A0AAV0GTS2_9ROSI|nr:unnamed protein product [Linum tenue]
MAATIRFCLLVSLFASITLTTTVQAHVFDVTKYGGSPNSDITQAFLKAFADACASPIAAFVVIPDGTYQIGVVNVKGPCKAPVEIQLQGILKAPVNTPGDAWFTFGYIDHFSITGCGTFDGMGSAIYGKSKSKTVVSYNPRAQNIRFNYITNGKVEGITSKDSKQFHINVLGCKNLIFCKMTIIAPADSPNTDGIHIGRSSDIQVLDTKIATGDDCISIGDGLQHLTVERVTCGPGHGISVGSLGRYPNEAPVQGIWVRQCTFKGTDNGVRIKSWPDMEPCEVSDVHFDDITMDNVCNPIIIDQVYCPSNECKSKIRDVSFKNIKGTVRGDDAIMISCSPAHPCANLCMSNIDLTSPTGKAKATCLNVKPIITGTMNPAGC